jgi:hypothetical protein
MTMSSELPGTLSGPEDETVIDVAVASYVTRYDLLHGSCVGRVPGRVRPSSNRPGLRSDSWAE